MTWKQLKEMESENFVFIGHHSHTHEYLIEETYDQFALDIEQANKIFLINQDIYQVYFLIRLANTQSL